MIATNSIRVLYCFKLLCCGAGVCLFSACNLSKDEIPEPDYDPFVLKPDSYFESEGKVVNMDSMAPPDEFTLRGKWMTAEKLKSTDPENIYFSSWVTRHPLASISGNDTSQQAKPIRVPANGVRKWVTFPKSINTTITIESNGDHYLGLLNTKTGLISDWVECLLEDRLGRIWIGSGRAGGVSIWDGSNLINLTSKEGLPEGKVNDLLEDSKGNIWIALNGGGLLKWSGTAFTAYSKTEGLTDNMISCLMENRAGNIWIGSGNGVNVFDGKEFLHFYRDQGLSHNHITSIAEDRSGRIWVGTQGKGVNVFEGNKFSQITSAQGLTNDFVKKIIVDKQGTIWIGTHGGLNKWDHEGLSAVNPDHQGKINLYHGIQHPAVIAIMEDAEGKIWIGNHDGVTVYDGEGFTYMTGERIGLKIPMIRSLLHDSSGRIWLGTAKAGLYSITSFKSKHYTNDVPPGWFTGYRDILEDARGNVWVLNKNLNSMSLQDPHVKNVFDMGHVLSLGKDSYGSILAGSMALKIIDPQQFSEDKPQFLDFTFENIPSHEAKGMISILEDRNGNIWMGAREDQGLFYWDRSKGYSYDSITFLRYARKQGLESSWIYSLMEDQQGRIWIGSGDGGGISVWDGHKFTKFTREEGLTDNLAVPAAVDHDGHVWIISPTGGINIWDGQGFHRYTEFGGFPAQARGRLFVDKDGSIWAGAISGVIKFRKGKDGALHYKQLNEYNGVTEAVHDFNLTSDGKLWACSEFNLDIVDLGPLAADTNRPRLSVLQVQPFFDQLDWGQLKQATTIGKKAVNTSEEISRSKVKFDSVYRFTNLPADPSFPFNINHLTFQWSSRYWAGPTSVKYSYLLEGKDQAWSPLVNENKVTYNDLRPGEYTLKVRAVAGNAKWSDTASYSFRVRPPWWATAGACTLYGLCALGLVLGLRHYEKKRFVLRQQAQSLKEIDEVKTEFFTNISHELRTPLTLIMGPLKTLQDGTYEGDQSTLLKMMSQNGKRLLRLVNQLLDLSKLDQGKLKLELQDCHIYELVWQVLANFDAACSLKNIELEFHENENPFYGRVDVEKIRQVLYNLVSNALKFTPEGGHIQVGLRQSDSRTATVNGNQQSFIITVRDSGIGIPKEELGHIFDRFYQVKNAHQDESEGTGIGLALAQKLVQLHEGTIEVESEPGWGSTFTVTLPLVKVQMEPVMGESGAGTGSLPLTEPDPMVVDQGATTNSQHPVLLIVEDNAQMRQYIRTCLGSQYHYLEASDGVHGLKIAMSSLPDLIICDVMMPVMDGYEFCKKVLEQQATAHIPFIFLTARADHDSRIKGLGIGSNDYLIKPFDAEELNLKIRNHLDRINQFRRFFTKQLSVHGEIASVESLDEKFLHRAINVVQDHIDNHEFTVNQFSHQVGMSQTQLYRKLIALTGQSPSAFIRSIRLKKAAQLILQNYGNSSDVAYTVGFNNLSYFAKCFKEQFGVSPGGYGKTGVRNS